MSTDYTTGTPWLDCDLDGNVTEATPISLKDHFALAINKEKILKIRIPEGVPAGGTMTDLQLQNVEDTKKMFLGSRPKTHDARLAYDLFHLMMDWESRNARGAAPLKAATDAIEAVDSIEALNRYFLETPPEEQLAGLWDASAAPDFMDSSHCVLGFASGNLLLEDSAEYRDLTEYGKIKKDAVTVLLKKVLVRLGYSEKEAAQKLENCFAFETLIAPVILTKEEMSSPDFLTKVYNPVSYDEAVKLQGKLPILEELEKEGFPKAEKYLNILPGFLPKLNELYTEENLPLIRDYLIAHSVMNAVGDLDRQCFDWRIEYRNAITGATGSLPDEARFSLAVADKLPWPVGRLYAETYLRKEDKDRILKLMDRLIEAYHGIIGEADFLSDTTKARAIEKLESISREVLYPDDWSKYECSELNYAPREEGGRLWEALAAIRAYKIAENLKEYLKPVDKSKWITPPSEVNCQYFPTNNSVYIMGAFAQGAIYRSEMSDEEVLGKLGWVIGHEISHAFDSSGAQFDKDGNMLSWWTEEDYAAFLKRNEKMAAYYNAMHPWAGQDFRGGIMTGEGCADMGGMKAVLRIAKQMEGFDYDRLFRSLGEVWLEKGSLQKAYNQINDPHPMGYLRVNGTLQQFDEFLNFYGITEGDGMYLAPEDRVAIW